MQATLCEKAYQHVRVLLTRGELPPGQKLVTRNLANDIGVSLAPVREALSRLATEGLVEHVPGAGVFVRKLDRQDLEELYILRDAIESYPKDIRVAVIGTGGMSHSIGETTMG